MYQALPLVSNRDLLYCAVKVGLAIRCRTRERIVAVSIFEQPYLCHGGTRLTPNLSTSDEVDTKNKSGSATRVRGATYFISLALLAVMLTLSMVVGVRTLRALSFLYEMSPPPLHFRFIKAACFKVLHHDPVLAEFAIEGRRGPLEIRMLTPRDLPNAPIIVLVHGFASNGFRDVGLNRVARSLCRSGLRVVIPNIVSEEKLLMNLAAVNDVDDVIRWSATTSRQKVSIFGISFSGGMVITAAAQPGYADYVKMVLCVSGYNSIDRLGRYYLHDDVREPDSQPYPGTSLTGLLSPMALQYLDELVPPENVEALSRPLRMIVLFQLPADRVPPGLTAKQGALLDDLLNVRTPAMRERYHALLDRHREELAYISPAGKVRQVRGSLYLLHGYDDPVIPRGEAEWTQAETAPKAHVRVVITPWMLHGYLLGPVTLRERLRVTYFSVQMLDEAFRHVPLQSVRQ